jgi:putative flippase GtrA
VKPLSLCPASGAASAGIGGSSRRRPRIKLMQNKDSWLTTVKQLLRYSMVGLFNNLFGYLLYLLVTWLFLEPKAAVSILYPTSAFIGYFAHARYAFAYRGQTSSGLSRYVVAHAFGYGVNMFLLYVFSDCLHFPHQAVQAVAIFVVAGLLFLLFKYFVFATPKRPGDDLC